MRRIWNRLFVSGCAHPETLVINSVGVRRAVCESCGNVSFSIAPRLVMAAPGTEETEKPELPRAAGL